VAYQAIPAFYAIFVSDCFEYARQCIISLVEANGDEGATVRADFILRSMAAITGPTEATMRRNVWLAMLIDVMVHNGPLW
jgi:hypothetical protein